MKNKCYKQNILKKQLRNYKERGKKFVIWSLTTEKKQDIESIVKYIEPYLYQIKTKHFSGIRSIQSKLLKDLHFAYKKGKKYITKASLSEEEKELLRSKNISFKVVKYKIYL